MIHGAHVSRQQVTQLAGRSADKRLFALALDDPPLGPRTSATERPRAARDRHGRDAPWDGQKKSQPLVGALRSRPSLS